MWALALLLGGLLRSSEADTSAWHPVERAVYRAIQDTGLVVVHFWAPWCPNSQAELRQGWYRIIESHPDVRFLFVTIWSDGDDGRAVLERYAVGGQPNFQLLVLPGPSEKDRRQRRFMNLPVTWVPTTWIFRAGELRYAFNYGELRFAIFEQLLRDARQSWQH
jgi:hypothetical protein|nr:MAG: thiol reductase thioredoxin [Bacteroidota bacterium]